MYEFGENDDLEALTFGDLVICTAACLAWLAWVIAVLAIGGYIAVKAVQAVWP